MGWLGAGAKVSPFRQMEDRLERSAMATLIDLNRANQKVREIEKQIKDFAERQYMGVDHIVKQPGYRKLQADLRRAKSVVRSLERKTRR